MQLALPLCDPMQWQYNVSTHKPLTLVVGDGDLLRLAGALVHRRHVQDACRGRVNQVSAT